MRSILELLEAMPQEYVIIAPPNMVYRQDLDQLLQQHQASGADISVLYQNVDNAKSAYLNCDVLRLNRQKACCPSTATAATPRTARSPWRPMSCATRC